MGSIRWFRRGDRNREPEATQEIRDFPKSRQGARRRGRIGREETLYRPQKRAILAPRAPDPTGNRSDLADPAHEKTGRSRCAAYDETGYPSRQALWPSLVEGRGASPLASQVGPDATAVLLS
jgi:hypothetical protein